MFFGKFLKLFYCKSCVLSQAHVIWAVVVHFIPRVDNDDLAIVANDRNARFFKNPVKIYVVILVWDYENKILVNPFFG